jgi:hypothetical protein
VCSYRLAGVDTGLDCVIDSFPLSSKATYESRLLMHCPLGILGGFDQCSSKRLFCFLRDRSRVGDPYGRREGYGTTVGKRERVPGAAKIEPLRERLSGMCGSVRH